MPGIVGFESATFCSNSVLCCSWRRGVSSIPKSRRNARSQPSSQTIQNMTDDGFVGTVSTQIPHFIFGLSMSGANCSHVSQGAAPCTPWLVCHRPHQSQVCHCCQRFKWQQNRRRRSSEGAGLLVRMAPHQSLVPHHLAAWQGAVLPTWERIDQQPQVR